MLHLNQVTLTGRLTADPELKTTPSGVAVTSFTIAVERRYSKDQQKQTDFIDIVAWRQTAQFICNYFRKGSAICIIGEIQTRSWSDAEGRNRRATEVKANEVQFCEPKKETEGGNPTEAEYPPPTDFVPCDDDKLPF